MKKILILCCCLALCLAASAVAEEDGPYYQLGDQMEDFTITTYDGQIVTLSELLREKDMVLLNIWATWCGPCEMEFPAMEAAYEAYQDRVAIVALSCEPEDTDEVLADYVSSHGMTFFVGRDEDDLMSRFDQEGIPTSVVIDRNGVICFIECGAMASDTMFSLIFDQYVGEEYDGPVLLTETPQPKPTVAQEDPAVLAAALEVETALNPEDPYTWPMIVAKEEGRTVLVPSNTENSLETRAEVSLPLTVSAGDAIAVTLKTDTMDAFDVLSLSLDGETVKGFSGEMDWLTYAIPVENGGTVVLTITYSRYSEESYSDAVMVDTVAVLSGDEAAAALAANTVYPVSETLTITPVTEGARLLTLSDESVFALLGVSAAYIIPGDLATFEVTIDSGVDPDVDFGYSDFDNEAVLLRDALTGDGVYVFASGMDSLSATGYCYTDFYVWFDDMESEEGVLFFASEENANYFFYEMMGADPDAWAYADGGAPSTDALPGDADEAPQEAEYIIRYVNQDGNPVPGVTCQVCDDTTCVLYFSDMDGLIRFTSEPCAWEIHTLRVPAGYEGDTDTTFHMPEEGGELELTLTRVN